MSDESAAHYGHQGDNALCATAAGLTQDAVVYKPDERPLEICLYNHPTLGIHLKIADIPGSKSSGLIAETDEITGECVQLGMCRERLRTQPEWVLTFCDESFYQQSLRIDEPNLSAIALLTGVQLESGSIFFQC